MTDIVYLNGEYLHKSHAKVSVLDRGFLFGDGIYEVIPVYQGKLFRFKQHLARLNRCLEQILLPLALSEQDWLDCMTQLIEQNGGGNLSLYIQVTRGIDPIRFHGHQKNPQPTVFMMTSPLQIKENVIETIKVALLEDTRWHHCDIKSVSLLGHTLLYQQALAAGYDEAILRREQHITEGCATNVFIVKQGVIYTPEKSQWILSGITRDLIIELAENAHIKVVQQTITIDDLLSADEVWLSSSTREISPVIQIDDKIVGNGQVGEIASTLHAAFQTFKMSLVQSK